MPRPWSGVRRLAVVAALALAGLASAPGSAPADDRGELYLVTLEGPGLSGQQGHAKLLAELRIRAEQDRVLESVGAPAPVYSWRTALNGFAAVLTPDQAEELAARPDVALVERNQIRRLAATERARLPQVGLAAPSRGGAGTVIGVVDSGIDPESRLFADVPGLGRRPEGFRGSCSEGDDWDPTLCNGKLVAAQWYVEGFDRSRLRAAASLSPRDTDGHGTQMASIAAGNADVEVRVPGQAMGRFGGRAPEARLAVYKACWGAPDPADDGCATADLVTAIDRATRDGVDVLNLAVGGPAEIDTVERALLGAAEADIVVIAAAGNEGHATSAAHPGPWVTTVGGTTSSLRRGRVVRPGAAPLGGVMVATRPVGPARLVLGGQVPAPGSPRGDARVCAPGSLDAGRVEDRIVVCERGQVGRVDKSRAVALADGVGMVLVNDRRRSLDEDFHSVPTVHVTERTGRLLGRWLRKHPAAKVSLRPSGLVRSRPMVARWSSGGDPTAPVLKPDVVAPGTGILGAIPADSRGVTWEFGTGTSAATAYTAGVAATLLGRGDLSASEVRSAIATTAQPLTDGVLAAGSGLVRPAAATRPGLVHAVEADDYRAWLGGRLRHLNTPSIRLADGRHVAVREVTNVGRRAHYFSSRTVGLRGRLSVRPAALRLDPGETASYRVTATGPIRRRDHGYVVWRGATGTVTRVPVLVSR